MKGQKKVLLKYKIVLSYKKIFFCKGSEIYARSH